MTRDAPLLELIDHLAPLLASDAQAEGLLPLRAVTPPLLLDRMANGGICPVCRNNEVAITLRDPVSTTTPPRGSYGRWSECASCNVEWADPGGGPHPT